MAAKKRLPSPLTILMLVVILAAIATWLLPAGKYDTLTYAEGSFAIDTREGVRQLPATQQVLDSLQVRVPLEKLAAGSIRKPLAIPGTYHLIEESRQGPIDVIKAPVKGSHEAVDIIFLILFIGSFIQVFNATGAMGQGLHYLTEKMKGRESWLIIILTFLFSLGGSTYGMAEETFAFYPILAPLFIAAGYDMMIPLAIMLGGTSVGFLSSVTNPFSTIIASNAAGINWTDGFYGRVVMFVLSTTVLVVYILRYASKVKKDPAASLVHRYSTGHTAPVSEFNSGTKGGKLSARTRLLLFQFLLTFLVMIVGVVYLEWWLTEMSALFVISAIIMGLVAQLKEREFVSHFLKGAEEMLAVALIVGVARGVTIILNDGKVSDTIVYHSSTILNGLPAAAFVLVLLVLFALFTLFIPSSSGMAVLTMPIIGSLAFMSGVPAREAVNAYLFGMGLMGMLTPTGLMLPSLAMVNVSLKAWVRFIMPLILWLLLLCCLFLVVSVFTA